MAVLYQKYRPQRFSEVIGQDGIVRTLLNSSAAGEFAHAYLFTGSRGIGKTSIARIIAKAANCLNLQDGDPCGECEPCKAITSGHFLDVVEIDAASHTGVDNIRELIEHVQFRPTSGKMKVFIIDEVHMLSKSAFNALLKTLEEPPVHAMFILATTDIEKVPETIVSRTQRFDFRKISPDVMGAALEGIAKKENIALPEGSLQLIVSNSEGGMRDALSLLGTIAALGNTASAEDVRKLLGLTTISAIEDLIGAITSKDSSGIPPFFEDQATTGVDFSVFNRNVLEYLRLMLVYKVTGQTAAASMGMLDDAQNKTMKAYADLVSMPQLMFLMRLFLRSFKEISQSPLPELPMLMSAIEATLHLGNAVIAKEPRPAMAPSVKPQVNSQTFSPDNGNVAQATATVPDAPKLSVPKITEESPSDDNIALALDMTKEDVLVWWPEVIQRIKTVNSPLSTLLKNSPLQDVSAGKITIGVKYLFHKEHIENTKHTALILETITAVCGKRMFFKSVIVKSQEEPVVAQTVDALTEAIKIFGGELVE